MASEPILRIVDWEKIFENNRSREIKRLTYVCVPNKQDGDGYTELVDHPEGAAHLGCWLAIVQVASKCDPRGTLMRDGLRPHTAATVSRISRLPAETIQRAIDRLVCLGWMERIHLDGHRDTSIPQEGAGKSQVGATSSQVGAAHTGGEGIGGEETGGRIIPPVGSTKKRGDYDPDFESWWLSYPRKRAKGTAATEWAKAVGRIASRRGTSRPEAVAWLLEVTKEFAASEAAREVEFVLWPERWLKRSCFDDDRSEWKRTTGGSGPRPLGSGPGQVFVGGDQPSW